MPELHRKSVFSRHDGVTKTIDVYCLSDNWFRTITYCPGVEKVGPSVVVVTNETIKTKDDASLAYGLIRSLWPFW